MNLLELLTETTEKEELYLKRLEIVDNITEIYESKISNLLDNLVDEIKKEKLKGKKLLTKVDTDNIKLSLLNYFENYINRKI
jgi:hypothetical protein